MANLIHIPDKAQIQIILGDGDGKADASVLIGGSMTDRFWPTIQAGKWNNEAWLSISRKGVDIPRGELGAFRNGRMELIMGNIRDTYYVTPNGHLEYEISFNDSLPTYIDLELDFPDGMSFWKQLTLTEEEIAEGCRRPEDVINSYVFKWCKRNNDYKTGKLGHLYRQFLRDANGNKVWCDQEIDGNVLRIITGNEDWLRHATYPVIVGPNLGYDTPGASNTTAYNRVRYVEDDTDATGGNVQNFHVAVFSNSGVAIKMGLYDDNANPDNLEEQVSWTPGVSDNESQASSDNDLLTGLTTHWVAITAELVGFRQKFDSVAITTVQNDSITWADEMLAVAVITGASNADPSIWIDYTAAAGHNVAIIEHHLRMMRNQ